MLIGVTLPLEIKCIGIGEETDLLPLTSYWNSNNNDAKPAKISYSYDPA